MVRECISHTVNLKAPTVFMVKFLCCSDVELLAELVFDSVDCGEAYSRLFDHRPVLRGEINFMLREFEVELSFSRIF